MEYPKWYQSSAGPGIASTVQGLAGTFLPVINLILGQFGYSLIENATANALLSAVVFVGFSLYTVFGYVRAKRVLGARIHELEVLAGAREDTSKAAGVQT